MRALRQADWRAPVALVLAAVLLSLPLPFYTRQWHKLMHVVGAVLFIGNIVVTAAWMILAALTRQRAVAHFAARMVTQADLLFTIPGILLLLINGVLLAPAFGDGNVFGASWVVAALALLILSGVVWLVFLLRYQADMTALSATGEQLSAEFFAVFRRWAIWGAVATLLPIASLALMVFKPTLWA